MKFEELVSGKLWAVRDDQAESHELEALLDHWNDVVWLRDFFVNNQEDLKAFYHVGIEDAIWDTIEDSVRNFLLNEHIIDDDSFIEYIAEL